MGISIIVRYIYKFIKKLKDKTTSNLNDLLNNVDYNSINWREDFGKALDIKQTV